VRSRRRGRLMSRATLNPNPNPNLKGSPIFHVPRCCVALVIVLPAVFDKHISQLKVPCSYELTVMGKFVLLMYMSKFRLRISSFCFLQTRESNHLGTQGTFNHLFRCRIGHGKRVLRSLCHFGREGSHRCVCNCVFHLPRCCSALQL